MKTTERFDRAIKALVKGFFNETLIASNCCACAVGNIVAGGFGGEVIPYRGGFAMLLNGKISRVNGEWFVPTDEVVLRQCIDASGYTLKELRRIERVFIEATAKFYSDFKSNEANYHGLMAVVDVLLEIEGMNKQDRQYHDLFKYTEDFKPVINYEAEGVK